MSFPNDLHFRFYEFFNSRMHIRQVTFHYAYHETVSLQVPQPIEYKNNRSVHYGVISNILNQLKQISLLIT